MQNSYSEEYLKENIQNVWVEYRKGVDYNRRKNMYTDTEKNYNFYYGRQWENANLGDVQPIVHNIVKPIVKYKLGVIYQNHYEIDFNPNGYSTVEEGKEIIELCKILNKHIQKVWELQQADKKVREATKDACINDEGIIHNYFDDEIVPEVIDKNNICYGNENSPDIQSQPYIIISYRRPVTEVQDYARSKLGLNEEKINLILSDEETLEQSGYSSTTDEVNEMCLVLLKYYRKNGKVYYTRTTKYVELEKDKSTGLSLYPIAHINWEEKKGSSRGVGAVNCIIPNQIEINKIDARRALSVEMGAFQKLVYNEDLVQNGKALSKVGGIIRVKGGASVDDVRKAIGYISPSTMSTDAKNLSDEMKTNTRDLEGAGDTATGNVDPTQASGKAILAVQQASQQPLSEQVENYKAFVEDIARIWFDMWKAYEVKGLSLMYEQKDSQGNIIETPGTIAYEKLEQLKPYIKVDITPRSPYDRFAQEQSLENLFMNQIITFEEFVDALPEGSVMSKATLENILQKRKETEQRITDIELQADAINSAKNMIMYEEGEKGSEVSTMQTGGNDSEGSSEQPNNIPM